MCCYQPPAQTPQKCWSRSCTFWFCFRSPSGPRRRIWLALLPLFSLPNPPHSPSDYYNSTSIFSHDKLLMGNTPRLRTRAGVVLQDLVKHCSLTARAKSFMEKDPSGFKFKILEEETKYKRKKLVPKGLGVLGPFFFFLRGGRLECFVCLWVWFSAGLFCAYLWNCNNWN